MHPLLCAYIDISCLIALYVGRPCMTNRRPNNNLKKNNNKNTRGYIHTYIKREEEHNGGNTFVVVSPPKDGLSSRGFIYTCPRIFYSNFLLNSQFIFFYSCLCAC